MSDQNSPSDPDQPPPYAQGGYGAPQQPQGGGGQPPQGAYQPPPGGYQQPQGGYQQPQGGYQQAPVPASDERTWAMLGHLGGIVVSFVAGLVVYLVYKDRSQYLKEQGAEALNFQITIAIAGLVASILTAVSFGILFFLPFVVWVVQIVFAIIAGLAANKHENYRYPFSLRLIK